jgi:hypothetical protein
MENETWIPAIAGIVVVITICLIVSLYKELHWLRIMTFEDRSEFKGLFWTQAIMPVFIFILFQVMIWRAILRLSVKSFELAMYTALTYTLFFAAMRSVILVGASFSAIVILHNCRNRKN